MQVVQRPNAAIINRVIGPFGIHLAIQRTAEQGSCAIRSRLSHPAFGLRTWLGASLEPRTVLSVFATALTGYGLVRFSLTQA
jgi:hypothetical protein